MPIANDDACPVVTGDDGVVKITLHRAEHVSAWCKAVRHELRQVLQEVPCSSDDCWCAGFLIWPRWTSKARLRRLATKCIHLRRYSPA